MEREAAKVAKSGQEVPINRMWEYHDKRWTALLDGYVDAQGPVAGQIREMDEFAEKASRCVDDHEPNCSCQKFPRPDQDNPMFVYLLRGWADFREQYGDAEAAFWLARNAWTEGAISTGAVVQTEMRYQFVDVATIQE